MKPVEVADFPRTALISIASVSVIMVIAVVVFCVFRCRQNPPPSDHYPMSGYTPIAPELSPPLGMDRSTQPLLGRPAPQVKYKLFSIKIRNYKLRQIYCTFLKNYPWVKVIKKFEIFYDVKTSHIKFYFI
uniref:Synaptotagmin n=1 Tax=Heterorhabditis bacteriophora TaxID=37862 RepID=A0A1I7WCP5_HETBA